jgi:hypothetical protein
VCPWVPDLRSLTLARPGHEIERFLPVLRRAADQLAHAF